MRVPKVVDRTEVKALLGRDDVAVVEVLPRAEYEWAHLRGAVNLPLREMSAQAVASKLGGANAVVVYCHDLQCDLSARAAWRLASLDVVNVHEYAASKMDWLSFGLPSEGSADLLGHHVVAAPTCEPTDLVGSIRARVLDDPQLCAVVNDRGIVVGAIRPKDLTDDDRATVESIMAIGPPTVRPSEEVKVLRERLTKNSVQTILVTCSDGTLLGAFRR
jgi:rhodanese-related sulfurtransferase